MDNEIISYSLDKTCRTCLKNYKAPNLNPIFNLDLEESKQEIKIIDELLLFNLEIRKDDGLPQNICTSCKKKFYSMYEFRQTCQHSQDILTQYFMENSAVEKNSNIVLQTEIEFLNVAEYESNDVLEMVYDSSNNEEVNTGDELNDYELYEIDPEIEVQDDDSQENHMNSEEESNNMRKCDGKQIKSTTANLKHHIETDDNKVITHTCESCGKSFKNKYYLAKHVRIHLSIKPHKCDYCEKTFLHKNQKESHERTHTNNRPFLCTICGLSFLNTASLSDHLKKHNDRSHKCDECDKSFYHNYLLKNHKERMHSEATKAKILSIVSNVDRKYACSECGYRFNHAKNLKVHMKRIHLKLKPHYCLICKREFTLPADLRIHMMVHTGEKPHECSYCPRKFTLAPLLRRHMRQMHHDQNNDK